MNDKLNDITIEINELIAITNERNIDINDIRKYVNLDMISVDAKNNLKKFADEINIFDPAVYFKFGNNPMNMIIDILCLKIYKINFNEVINYNDIYNEIKSCINEMIQVSDIKAKKSILGSNMPIEEQLEKAKNKCDDTSYNFGNIAEKISNNLVNLKSNIDNVKLIKDKFEESTKLLIKYILIGKMKSTNFTVGNLYTDINSANITKEELDIQKINTENTMLKRVEYRVERLENLLINTINLQVIINNIYIKLIEYLNTTVVEEMASYEEEYNRNFGINASLDKKIVLDIQVIKRSNEKILNLINNRINLLTQDIEYLNSNIIELNTKKTKLNELLLEIQKDV